MNALTQKAIRLAEVDLSPFTIDAFGRVMNGRRGRWLKPCDRAVANAVWHRRGPRGERSRVAGGIDGLIRVHAGITWARWMHHDRTPRPRWEGLGPVPTLVKILPSEWIPLHGDPDQGWYALRMEHRFTSVLHGPSIAALIHDPSTTPRPQGGRACGGKQ